MLQVCCRRVCLVWIHDFSVTPFLLNVVRGALLRLIHSIYGTGLCGDIAYAPRWLARAQVRKSASAFSMCELSRGRDTFAFGQLKSEAYRCEALRTHLRSARKTPSVSYTVSSPIICTIWHRKHVGSGMVRTATFTCLITQVAFEQSPSGQERLGARVVALFGGAYAAPLR